jgi:lipopolysaccharide transport system ATP-binding protein
MRRPAIEINGLSKQYRIGTRVEGRTFREALVDAALGPLRRIKRFGRSSHREEDSIWALKDVSFAVQPGEVLGIIGRNGAGKSTLLKILSQITEPTEGSVVLRGRVGSLLEVGTGFHRELTGRENIFLSGAILGMSRREIAARFDEIVEFSGVEKFIDTQVKRYSSGMWVRLGFAVAAHLRPEILLIDEVLAVGDAEFRKKCLGKMDDVARSGRTVLFVSHNMAAVENLCQEAILLDEGKLIKRDAPKAVIEHYLKEASAFHDSTVSLTEHPNRRPGSEVILREVSLESDGRASAVVRMGEPLKIVTTLSSKRDLRGLRLMLAIEDRVGRCIMVLSHSFQAPHLLSDGGREGRISCEVPRLRLLSGKYYLTLFVKPNEYFQSKELDRVDRALEFRVRRADVFGTGSPPHPSYGVFFDDANWEFEPI